jgi:hypothetical protein
MRKVLVAAVSSIAILGLAAVTPGVSRAALQFGHDDRVHYFGHLAAGRLLSLCPCGTTLAERQYARGMFHARTPRQQALLTTARPTTLGERLQEAPRLMTAVVRRVAG